MAVLRKCRSHGRAAGTPTLNPSAPDAMIEYLGMNDRQISHCHYASYTLMVS